MPSPIETKRMAKVRRLATTIKGGVSLGAYEAGALHQTLALIARNNAIDGSTKWYVDVITGASAGSMTAASTAVALIAGPNVNPPNPFYSAWVQDVSVSALMPAGNSNITDNLFDATRLDQIAARNVRLSFNALHPHPAFNPATVLLIRSRPISRAPTSLSTVQRSPRSPSKPTGWLPIGTRLYRKVHST
jgi:predicted acylesterase/phospholipase RssA